MAGGFSESSLQVCKDFLQTAVIIDDRAYQKPKISTPVTATVPRRGAVEPRVTQRTTANDERYLDTNVLIKSFAEHGIICSALEFTDFSEDAIPFINTAKLADITIIDWEMEDEKNGANALKLMSSLLKDDFSSPQRFRLITVYTAAPELEQISQKIIAHVRVNHQKELNSQKNGMRLVYQSIVITIYAKDSHGIPDHLRFNVVDEKGLPERLVDCFAENIKGILPNTALSALTAIRHSTHRLLGIFNSNLDYAYLTHRASLIKPDDAGEHLEVLIAEEIESMLSSYDCIGKNASYSIVKKWLEERYETTHCFNHPDGTSVLDRGYILECLKSGFYDVSNPPAPLNNKKKQKLYQCFSNLLANDPAVSSEGDLAFAKLSVQKMRYKNTLPYLTMGVILENRMDKSLWLCIQPKCDSVRLKGMSNKFPLLPIMPGGAPKNALPKFRDSDTSDFFHVVVHPQDCQSIEFKSARKDTTQIFPQKNLDNWFFLTTAKRLRYRFIAELKDEQTQGILNDFAATTARVGVNPSEWLRRKGSE